MGACRTIDPARQAWRQQAPCRGARSDERDHVYFEHKGGCIDPHGYDAGKKVKGKKRHILVDTLGLLLHAIIHPADIQDRDGGILLLATLFGSLPMVATRGRTFKRPWRRSCHSSKLKSSSAPIGRKDSWCFHAVGSSNAPLLGSTAAEGLQRIGRTSIA